MAEFVSLLGFALPDAASSLIGHGSEMRVLMALGASVAHQATLDTVSGTARYDTSGLLLVYLPAEER